MSLIQDILTFDLLIMEMFIFSSPGKALVFVGVQKHNFGCYIVALANKHFNTEYRDMDDPASVEQLPANILIQVSK